MASAIINAGAAARVADPPDAKVAIGGRFYREGIAAGGSAVAATVQGDLALQSTNLPCTSCHRRSGWGTTEGPVTTPAVVGDVMFNPVTRGNPQIGIRTTGPGTRPAYDLDSLARALRDGVDPAGRRLSATMPTYAVSDAEVAALAAYLRTLGTPAPGVTETTLHLATITSPSADPGRREAMLSVMREFVRTMNSETRHQTRRRERGPWDMKAHYELYRRWELHEWSIGANPRDWPAQLAAQYASQPVFAVVGGVADEDWSPIHAFCEQQGVPCVFPQTMAPPTRDLETGFYSLYFSPGLALEGAALAEHLSKARVVGPGTIVVQITACGSPGEAAARVVTDALATNSTVVTRCVDRPDQLTSRSWADIVRDRRAVVVSWMGPASSAGLAGLAVAPETLERIEQVYLSSSALGERPDLPAAVLTKAFLLDPFVAPDEFDRHAARGLAWLRSRGITTADRRAAVNALFAMTIVGEAVAMPRVLASRDYFVEQIEHMVGRSPQPSAYPALSLGPRRRFASLGCWVLKAPSEPEGTYAKVAPWFIPELRQPSR